ncbi:hypothetical protein HS088_TW03G00357 [Tripterygium wilfordii]|uniref:FAD-binding FR-type domain-containing protein n=1 Tax=Tripterygium wilfordii TaxID=458696 RepID=A0A7J7DUI2_TRIWF|nr:hypothetical protein HS088_TW03G00357 [Tripterygium wilfordii]
MKFVAKKLDRRLSNLGASALLERGLGDDQHPSGYEGALDPWMSLLWSMLYQINPKFFKGPDFMVPDMKLIDQPKIKITYHDAANVFPLSSIASDIECMEMQIETARSMHPGKLSHSGMRPDCFLKMIKNQFLTRAGCGKDVRHFEFEQVSSLVEYEVGDVVEVLPSQNPEAIDCFIQRCSLNPDAMITVQPREVENDLHTQIISSKVPVKLKTFVELTMDRTLFFQVMSFFASAQHEKERLQYFASPEGRDDLYQYNQKERRTVLEVLEDFPSVQMPFEWLVQLVPPLNQRAFSISSSQLVHPNEVHLTVNVVSWTTPFKRKRAGLCSMWLAGVDTKQKGRGGGFYVAFSRDQPQKMYVQHKMQESSQRIWDLLLKGAAIYVAGSSTKMPAHVLSTLEDIVSKEAGVPKDSAVRWLRALERAGKYLVEAWS